MNRPGDAASTYPLGPHGHVMAGGASTPEELETLLEDAFVTRDHAALAALFEATAVLDEGDGPPARGVAEIARWATAVWADDRTYIAEPRQVARARDLALVVAGRGISVMRRGSDGAWRYAISLLSLDDATR